MTLLTISKTIALQCIALLHKMLPHVFLRQGLNSDVILPLADAYAKIPNDEKRESLNNEVIHQGPNLLLPHC